MSRVWISAGGTGGHIYPAIAIYDALKNEGFQVTYIGGDQESMEKSICHEKNINFHATNNLKWLGWLKSWLWLCHLMCSIIDLVKLSRHEKPDFILIMGGYPCVSSGLVAILTGTPLYLHEQNSVMGLTNRFMYRFVKKGFCAYKNLLDAYPKLIYVGNPSSITPVTKPRVLGDQKLKILSFGGSGGARQLNQLMQTLIETHALKDFEIWHIIGDYDDHMLKLNGEGIKIERYNDNIQEAYQWADLAITRSGAMTLTELTLAGLPALLLPFPFATHDHQKKNAAYYVSKGAAWMCEDSSDGIVKQVKSIQKSPKKYNEMALSMYDMIPEISSDKKIVSILLKTKAV